MNPQQVINFIRQQLIEGRAQEDIAQTLRMNNVPENEIALAFNAAEWQKSQNLSSPTYKIRRHGMIWLTIILLIILGVTGAGLYIVAFRPDLMNEILNKPPALPIVTPETVSPTLPPPVVTPVASSTATSTDMSDWKTYRNEEFGFELSFPPTWSEYSVRREIDKSDKSVYLSFHLPKYVVEGSSDVVFAVGSTTKKGWEDGLNEPHGENLGEKNGLVFVGSISWDLDRRFSLPDLELEKIFSTFRFTATSTPPVS